MRRICVLGVTGSGKSTLARALAERLGYRHVEMDALYWGPSWTPAPKEVLRARVAAALDADGWVADGNYSAAREVTWDRADTFVWLDLPFHVIFSRLERRTIRRCLGRVDLWNGNRERLWEQFLSGDSLFLWALKTYPRYRREYPQLLADQAARGRRVYRLRTQSDVNRWLDSIGPSSPQGRERRE